MRNTTLASLQTAETHKTRFLEGVSSRSNILLKALLEHNDITKDVISTREYVYKRISIARICSNIHILTRGHYITWRACISLHQRHLHILKYVLKAEKCVINTGKLQKSDKTYYTTNMATDCPFQAVLH